MPQHLLITPAELALALSGPNPPLVLDVSFDLADPAAGRRAHDTAHIPGSLYLHLDEDLSGAKTGVNGRHPLPDPQAWVDTLAARGLDDERTVVACDNAGGMYAARLWWMLLWIGHTRVQVLDGGLAAWKAEGRPLSNTPGPAPAPGRLTRRPPAVAWVDHATLRAAWAEGERLVMDARAPDRFRGENETLDPVAGHIPGAVNRFFRHNLAADGRFKPAAELRADFTAVLAGRPPSAVVAQCGSGVTACHNLLAMTVAGLPGAALYPGSWSEWCAQPGAPVATGP